MTTNKKTELATISVCMMVKNEEEMLPDCLKSVKPLADEIIVVDTGSTDRTVEIARSFGAKVFHHPWENDFSKHRNQSISYATGDWFLIIDADERLELEGLDVKKVKRSLVTLKPEIHALLAIVKDFDQEGKLKVTFMSARLFRNGVGVEYRGIVHNQPHIKGIAIPSDLVIKHYGYDLTPEKMEQKFRRTTELLLKRVQQDPGDYEAYFYLANIYGKRKMYADSVKFAEKCLEILPEDVVNREMYYGMYYVLGVGYIELGDYKKAKDWMLEGLKKLEPDVDLYYTLCRLGLISEDFDLVLQYAPEYLKHSEDMLKRKVIQDLRFVYHLDEEHRKMVKYFYLQALLGKDKQKEMEAQFEELKGQMGNEPGWQEEFLNNLIVKGYYEQAADAIIYWHQSANKKIPYIELVAIACENKPEAIEVLRKISHKLRDFADRMDFIRTAAQTLIKHNKWQESLEFFREYHETLPDDPMIISNYALVLSKTGNERKAEEVYRQGLEKSLAHIDFYMNAAHFFKDRDENLFTIALGKLLDKTSDYRELPEDILLLLAWYLMRIGKADPLVHVTQVLLDKSNMDISKEVNNLEEFAGIYASLGEYYQFHGRFSLMALAYEVAVEMSEKDEYLRILGDTYIELGNYGKAIKHYNRLLERGQVDRPLLLRMRRAFEKLGNREGMEECERLLENLG